LLTDPHAQTDFFKLVVRGPWSKRIHPTLLVPSLKTLGVCIRQGNIVDHQPNHKRTKGSDDDVG
jgi:hypothetical protein